ncbi:MULTISPECIES: dihydrofolate reductase family protein [Thermomonosporaceae]|uniref:dihydrofolate reductase family protein n=1 Tax=Thermomonosporaceae TaxID=2012 RepID=UPI00255A8A76|nr:MULTISPECIES: dihydrofolate reductase family protein [Thermomonosporaceae]MDL4774472.1 dihydrofolate reductase family protein [Actinomadura xylanilytica]
MGNVIVDLTVSLDGFVAGGGDGPGLPLGRGGELLFPWMNAGPEANRTESGFTPPDASKVVIDEWTDDCGALVSGRRTFDIAGGWKDGHPIDVPIFVVTHRAPPEGEWSPRVSFVTAGTGRALDLALEAAGDRKVSVCSADVVQQVLRAGRLDEIHLNVVPLLLGSGVRLFDHLGPDPVRLEQTRTIGSEGVTHLRYRVLKD